MRTLTTTPATRGTRKPVTRGLGAIARRVAVDLTPGAVDQVATRVAQLLRHQQQNQEQGQARGPVGLLTVSQLARHLGLNRAWVYEHADDLGAIRIGDGPKARIRFDFDTARAALRKNQASRAPAPASAKPRRKPPRPTPYPTDAPLLEIRDPYARGVRARFAGRPRRGRIGAI
jgi:hypothetical protein